MGQNSNFVYQNENTKMGEINIGKRKDLKCLS